MNFHQLTYQMLALHSELQSQAAQAVNRALTIRNWLMGYYIVEFEQRGADRTQYGEKLLKKPEEAFQGAEGMDERAFRNYRKFYLTYWGLLRNDKTNHNS